MWGCQRRCRRGDTGSGCLILILGYRRVSAVESGGVELGRVERVGSSCVGRVEWVESSGSSRVGRVGSCCPAAGLDLAWTWSWIRVPAFPGGLSPLRAKPVVEEMEMVMTSREIEDTSR